MQLTVLEEAHNLLKNTTTGGASELIGKSVEMITNTIAEIRTYGEGFIIVDQSPSSVDIAAIKNTNTKIVLRTPEANDREAVGRSIGLTRDQVEEIAKLPSGVAVVYQNNWISPVLTMINKADVEEIPYKSPQIVAIKPLKEARTEILNMLLSAWIPKGKLKSKLLYADFKTLNLNREYRDHIKELINEYLFCGGCLIWKETDIPKLQELLKAVLGITKEEFDNCVLQGDANKLINMIKSRTYGFTEEDVNVVCAIITKV